MSQSKSIYRYGQYCPVARAVEILGDRWTLLIVRDLLTGTRHFNDLARGLPGISRGLLSGRLERLEEVGIIEKLEIDEGRRSTAYELTEAGDELLPVLEALMHWGARWAFGQPLENELDPILLLWWMRGRVHTERLPQERVVIRFDFQGADDGTYWLVLKEDDVSICLHHPGFDLDVLVTADIAAFYEVWLGRRAFWEAIRQRDVQVEAIPSLRRAFPDWFALSHSAEAVRAAVNK
ncbi:MAG TPA: helix-turn-helix domain-containing protein [Candidatus Sulfomarinibacteraceae bacterium]|nr:helix-turn-helix domain-containing protein [Candidatus Sulfomarinibacteraceae bacterium]